MDLGLYSGGGLYLVLKQDLVNCGLIIMVFLLDNITGLGKLQEVLTEAILGIKVALIVFEYGSC